MALACCDRFLKNAEKRSELKQLAANKTAKHVSNCTEITQLKVEASSVLNLGSVSVDLAGMSQIGGPAGFDRSVSQIIGRGASCDKGEGYCHAHVPPIV